LCGGKDRFRFDDKDEGRWYCNHCGSGDGYTLLCKYSSIDFKTAKDITALYSNQTPLHRAKQPMSDAKKRELMSKVWAGAAPEALGLRDYLSSRGIPEAFQFNPTIRWHPDLLCTTHGSTAPAIVIKCYRWGIDGRPEPITLQRHWPALDTKMMMPAPVKLDGIFCPLGGKPGERMGVCEGYITALSCMTLQPEDVNMPVWACMSADQLMKFVPPPNVKMLYIYADVDKSWTGQAAAYALAKKLRPLRPDLETVVCYPTSKQNVDYDYNDLLLRDKPWPTASRFNPADAAATIARASHALPYPSIQMSMCAGPAVISATKGSTDLILSAQADASTPEKPADAATTASPIGEVHFTAHRTLDLPPQ
jgi:putative DNA primase/helicase